MLIQGCGLGEAGLQQQARLEKLTILFEQLDSTEQVRRHMFSFAYSRGLGPVLTTSHHMLGLSMQPLTGNTNRTPLSGPQLDSSSRTNAHHNHPNTDPVPYEDNGSLWWLEVDGMTRGG